MEYSFTSKYSIGQTVYLAVAESESYLITDVVFSLARQQIIYELMNSSGFRDSYTAIEITSERMIEV